MKNLKRIICALFTLVLSFCAINAVMAATNNGTVTVKNAVKDKYYSIYRIFDLTLKGEGESAKVAYTINSAWEDFFYTETEKDGKIELTLKNDYIKTTNTTGNLNQVVINNKVYYINITDTNIKQFTKDALTYAGTKSPVAREKGTGKDLTFTGLELGYYLVYPEGATEKDTNGTICSITSTVPNAEVTIKATYPKIEKELAGNHGPSFEVGEKANFVITGKVPDTTGFTTYTYTISDTWSKGLDYEKDEFNLVVKVGNNIITDYTLTLKEKETGFDLTIPVKNYTVGDTIEVTYSVVVTSEAINSKNTNNSATLTYSNDPKSTTKTTTDPIVVPVYSSSIEVTKLDGADTSIKLAGAKFVLKNSEGKYYSIIGYGWSQDEQGNNIFRANDIEWVTNIADATVFTTNENGTLEYEYDGFTIGTEKMIITSFEGLKDGTYYLVETEAPQGYNKLTKEITVTVDGDEDETKRPIPVKQEIKVENFSGTALPSTGGMGTTLFVVIGSLLAIASAVIFVTNKRIAKEM